MKKITIYSTETCHYCKLAKSYFDAIGLKYTEIDVVKNPEKRDELLTLTDGQLVVPVIKINENVLLGFDEGLVAKTLE